MDAFYAAVEQRDHPELRGKPVAVGGSPTGRGVLTTASYEARKFGVRSAMPSATAIRLCPQLIIIRPRMDVYVAISKQIRAIFRSYTDLVEPLSIDEAFLDVTTNKLEHKSAIHIAQLIRQQIKEQTDLTASAGVSVNKFLAKLASGMKKPDGLTFIDPLTVIDVLDPLKVSDLYGIGKSTTQKMNDLGIETCHDLRQWEEAALVRRFGKMGKWYYKICRGEDDRPVVPDRKVKSVSVEDTFGEDQLDIKFLHSKIEELASSLHRRLQKRSLEGKTITLKVKYGDFQSITRSATGKEYTNQPKELSRVAKLLLKKTDAGAKPIRLLGLGISNFPDENISPDGQLKLEFD